ncbi:MAG: hypothetical protein HRT47_10260 [Candidatus Caenarcaniphilales bacterium]|nr:hypothetical protein [Candidatus Caenarcaniphilales bacterium]
MPGYHENYEEVVFHPDYLKLLEPFKVFRYMDFMKTNNSSVSSWSERTLLTSHTQRLTDGVSHEHIIDMSNRAKVDPWICIPHMADDNYIREAAKLYKANLDKNLDLYVEYSNEVWNWQFKQARYADDMGKKLGLASLSGGPRNNFFSMRTVQIIKIFEEVFAEEKDRIVGIMAGQSVNPWHLERMLEYNWSETPLTHAEAGVDAIAIAPYFNLRNYKDNLATYEAWSDSGAAGLDKLFEELRNGTYISVPSGGLPALESSYADFVKNKVVADREGLALVAYEGGQHLSAHGGLENNAKLQSLLIAANRDPRMGEIYDEYFRKWFEIGGGVFANFSFIGQFGKWGSWGVLESQYQDPNTAYKYVSLSNYSNELNEIYESQNDLVPPSEVGALTVSNITETSITLNWIEATDNVGVSKYQVYRDSEFVAETSDLSFLDIGLVQGTLYNYSVVAFDLNGNQSAPVSLDVTTAEELVDEIIDEDISDFITVETCEGLEAIAEDLEANYKLEADIDCKDYLGFDPIGNWKDGFAGIFDGQGFAVKNLTVTDMWGAGLFTKISSGTVRNLNLENSVVDTNSYLSGLLAGISLNSVIDNVHVTGKIIVDPDEPKGLHGGLVGNIKAENGTSSIINSSADIHIDGKFVMSGGIAGNANGSSGVINISDTSFHGLIDAKDGNRTSPILGTAHSDSIQVNIDKCFTDATLIISGNRYGSFLGQANKAAVSITNSYSRMKVYSSNLWGNHQLYGQDLHGTVSVENCFIDSNSLIDSGSRKLDGTEVIDFNIQNDLLYGNLFAN